MSEMVECRFDARRVDVPPNPDETATFHYLCEKCGQWHWAIPEFEADGTAATSADAMEAIKDALDAYYINTTGMGWRERVPHGLAPFHAHPDWRPLPQPASHPEEIQP